MGETIKQSLIVSEATLEMALPHLHESLNRFNTRKMGEHRRDTVLLYKWEWTVLPSGMYLVEIEFIPQFQRILRPFQPTMNRRGRIELWEHYDFRKFMRILSS